MNDDTSKEAVLRVFAIFDYVRERRWVMAAYGLCASPIAVYPDRSLAEYAWRGYG